MESLFMSRTFSICFLVHYIINNTHNSIYILHNVVDCVLNEWLSVHKVSVLEVSMTSCHTQSGHLVLHTDLIRI